MFKDKLEFIENPLIWTVNIAAAVLSWKYWDGLDTGKDNIGNGAITIAALIVLTVSSFWIYFRADKKVRDFLSSEQQKPLFTIVESLATIRKNPVKFCLYAKSSEGKFQAAFALASVWTSAILAIALTGPSGSTIEGIGVRVIPYVGLTLAVIVWITTAYALFMTHKIAEKDWFSLTENPPTAKVPSEYVQGSVMCRSPDPLESWGKKNFHVCNISDINGPRMPNKDDVREKILWSYMKLPM